MLVRTHGTGRRPAAARDSFSLARELLGWDPFVTARPAAAFAPTFEVKETTDAFVLRADVPGVEEKDLDIAIHNGVLTVSGHRKAEDRAEGARYSLSERTYGAFTRSFSLPDIADGERIEAKLERGVLALTVGKRTEAKPRKIALNK